MSRKYRHILLSVVAALSAAALAAGSHQSATAAQARPTEHIIEIKKFNFVPNVVRIRSGDTVTWINRDIAPHTATGKNNSWDTGAIKKGDSASLTMSREMTVAYFCRFHPGMKATIEIIVNE